MATKNNHDLKANWRINYLTSRQKNRRPIDQRAMACIQ